MQRHNSQSKHYIPGFFQLVVDMVLLCLIVHHQVAGLSQSGQSVQAANTPTYLQLVTDLYFGSESN